MLPVLTVVVPTLVVVPETVLYNVIVAVDGFETSIRVQVPVTATLLPADIGLLIVGAAVHVAPMVVPKLLKLVIEMDGSAFTAVVQAVAALE